ncbi:MAG TPA: HlyD family efflux transporter periplasmic adaptor subunit [Pirellulales bacterium]|nr:HlyD family efflux transporter periplasmic adaptor subunit [Pirellulales bacterium]
MATTTAEEPGVSQRPQNGFAGRSPRRNGSRWFNWVLTFVGMLGAGGVLYLSVGRFYASENGSGTGRMLTTPVKKGDLLITVTEDGNVESANNVELKCKVPGPITILEIVPDGSHVEEGEQLVRLDSSSLEDSVLAQQIVKAKAVAAKITSEKNFAAAKIAVDEYEQGTFPQEMEEHEADITVAQQDLSSAQNQLFYSRKMHRKGYVAGLDVESKEFAVEQAKLHLTIAERKKAVAQKFTRLKTLEDLTSKRDSAQALMESDLAALKNESNKLQRLEDQLKECTIVAPQAGMVVYANDNANRMFQQGPKVDLGAQVNQFQAILRLPDLKNMQVKTLVHETKVDQLRLGMRARIKIQDREFQGAITSIANQPEAANWFQGNVKEYATLIKIDGEPEDLKPGMTAEIEILVDEKQGVLQVPVQCVVESGRKFHAYVQTPTGIEVRDLVLGGTNDTVIEIIDGLKEGELVLLNPRADVPDAKDEHAEAQAVDSSKRFGSNPAKTAAGGTATAPAGGTSAAPGGSPAAGATSSPAGGTAGGATAPAGGKPNAPGGAGGFKLPTFKEQDKDGDGVLTREENPSPWFDKIDTNSNGTIDPKEYKAAMDAAKKLMAGQGGAGGPGGAPGGAP